MPEAEPVRIPHAPPLRLARQCQRLDDGSLLVEAWIDAGSPAAVGGSVRRGYLVEIAAQAAAAWRGSDGTAIRVGRLVGLADWRFVGEAVLGAPIQVRIRQAGSLGPLSAFDVQLEQDGRALAAGRLQVHLSDRP